ncbi:YrbL family protein [Oceanobacter mangrovi]|uniref:YrbL family protein n=1 Tax=Oceanobacter mangrovi TaxID=2862510 RepID=UPI001C8D561F|nr:YrbL family protein [Oceanobacter mangrovi]
MAIQLTSTHVIGIGRDRICYRHPSDPDFCIKLPKHREKQTRREKEYFLYLLKKGADLRYVATYMGDVETSLGTGALFPMIHDDHGEVSLTLTQVIQQGLMQRDQIEQGLERLYDYLVSNGICTRDISPNNIVCRRRGKQVDFILIDGVSSPNHNPLTIRIPALIRQAVNKSWRSLMTKVERLLQESEALGQSIFHPLQSSSFQI